MDNPVFYALEADDLPSCPRDGVRIFTTPLVGEGESGVCPRCQKTFFFYVEGEKA
jgi:uncharacterized paraquat-inducible protein A